MSALLDVPHLDPDFPWPPVDLVESDGEPLESFWQQQEIILLADILYCRFAARQDFYAAGNMFIYYIAAQVRNQDYKGPDFFFVDGVNRFPIRKYWVVWDKGGRYPNLIVELQSPSTAKVDRTTKKDLYENVFRTPEYFLYDPDSQKLEGWRLDASFKYQPVVPNDKGWMWSQQLNCWLGIWQGTYVAMTGTWLRYFDEQGKPYPTFAEAETAKLDRTLESLNHLQRQVNGPSAP